MQKQKWDRIDSVVRAIKIACVVGIPFALVFGWRADIVEKIRAVLSVWGAL